MAVPIAPIAPTMTPGAVQANGAVTAGMMQIAQGFGAAGAQQAAPASFQEFFADVVKKTNSLEQAADEQQKQLLLGNVDNLHDVTIAMEKADMAFQLTLAIRGKIIDAYTSVMQMQI